MAWLKGLAGKAEDFLNQIDQNAAVVLTMQKDKVNGENQLTEVTWEKPIPVKPVEPDSSINIPPTTTTVEVSHSNASTSHSSASSTGLNSVRSSPNLSSFTPIRSSAKTKKDDDLIDFLNSSTSKSNSEQVQGHVESRKDLNTNTPLIMSRKSSPLHIDIVNETMSTSTYSGTSRSSSRRESPDKELLEKLAVANQTHATNRVTEELKTENEMLKNELRSFNNEMSLLLQRAKTAEKESSNLQQQLTKLQAAKTQSSLLLKDKEDQAASLEIELKLARQELSTAMLMSRNLETANSKLMQELTDSSGYQNEELRSCRQQLTDKDEELLRSQSAHKQEVISIKNTIKSFESEQASLSNQIAEIQQLLSECRKECVEWQDKYDKSRVEMLEVRAELDQYRARAQRILHDKDKLIAELRGEGIGRGSPVDDVTAMELEQLRQERELLREEAMQVSARLQATRTELGEAEHKMEASREQAATTSKRLQQNLQEEKMRRQAAEEDCRTQAEGLRSVREELSRQRALLASKVQEREAELTKLRLQLSQRPSAPLGGELESRLHALTQTLVQKQTALETASTERNALRLQYEKLESKHRETLAAMYHSQGGSNVNDTDDAKARLPSFFDESPFDTGVARRVKRAYSNLDAVSIRTGVFLRRYPLARILMLSYMVLLHLWVMLVLFTYTPEVHPKKT